MTSPELDSQYDKLTKTPITKLLLTLSIPTILSMLITNIYNVVDTAFVGSLGNSASGSIGIVFGYMSILQAVGFLFGQGAGSIAARKLGAKDPDAASVAVSTGFFFSISLSAIIALFSGIFLDQLVKVLGSTDTIAPYAKIYLTYILISAPFVCSSFTLNNFLRYEGKAALGMVGMMTGAVLNIIGDSIFIFGFKMGIAGAGLSTMISQIIGWCILLYMFIFHKSTTRLSPRKINFRPGNVFEIIFTGCPSLIRQALQSIATIFLNMQAGYYGGLISCADEAIAAMSIVSRIVFFVFSISLGVGQGFQPISSFNYGARKYARVRKAFKSTLIVSEIVILALTTIVLIMPEQLVSLFRNDAKVIEIGTRALRLQSFAYLLLPFCMVTEMLFQSTGHKVGAALLASTRSGLIFIPLLFIMSSFRGLSGVQEAQPMAFVLSIFPAIVFCYLFFKKLPKEDLD